MWGMDILREATGQQLGLTLLHFLWQGLLLAILLWGVVHLFRLKRGNQRYLTYLIGFLILLACPVVTFFIVDVEQVNRMSRRAQLITDMQAELQEYESSAIPISPTTSDEMVGMRGGRTAALARATVRFRDRAAMYAESAQPWIMGAWIVGMAAFALRMVCGLVGIVRWRRKLQPIPAELEPRIDKLGERMKLDRSIRICLSDRVKQAMAIGCLRPMIILPAAMITHMPVELLEAIIAHELAHIRRHDLWINLLQRMAEILFFFHPAVWLISKSLRRERELCCDEMAARAIGERATYAEALEKVSRAILYTKEPAFAAALGQRKKTVLSRVQHVLGLTAAPSHTGQAMMVILALAFVVLPITVWAIAAQGPSRILYVDDNAAPGGGGASWADAYQTLQDALDDAISGDEIRVAQGTYKPDQGGGETPGDRDATFTLKNGVALMGSFAGPGTADPDARDPNQFETILSGDLLGNDVTVADPCDLVDHPSRTDNSLHVVVGHNTDETAVLDGFTITGGNCDQAIYDNWALGGGMYNINGSPTLRDCIFRENSAGSGVNQIFGYGGGMENEESSPFLLRCQFIRNTISGYGTENVSSFGCGMDNYMNSSPTVLYCSFIENSVGIHGDINGGGGGGITNYTGSSPTILHCEFRENRVWECGAMVNDGLGTNPVISHCTFINNRATKFFGVMKNRLGASVTIKDCLFMGNSCDDINAVLTNHQSNSTIENCIFKDNSAKQGGCIYNYDCNPTIRNCLFIGNISEGVEWRHGGGIMNRISNPIIQGCIFNNNQAKNGGGIFNMENSNPTIINCSFSGNHATNKGGAIHSNNDSDSMTMINCTFSQNTSDLKGGGIAHDSLEPLSLINCILWDNTAPEGPQIRMGGNTLLKVRYCDIEGGQGGIYLDTGGTVEWGSGNIDEDPCFADPNSADYHLQSQAGRWDPNDNSWVYDGVTSPCIDAGDPNSECVNELWPHGNCVNMGAYGNTPEASMSADLIGNIADLNHDGFVNLEDYSFWAMNWMKEEILLAADLDRNGKVTLPDALIFLENWLWEE